MAKINKTYKPGDEFTPDSVNEIIAAINSLIDLEQKQVDYNNPIVLLKSTEANDLKFRNRIYTAQKDGFLLLKALNGSLASELAIMLKINNSTDVVNMWNKFASKEYYLNSFFVPVKAGDKLDVSMTAGNKNVILLFPYK